MKMKLFKLISFLFAIVWEIDSQTLFIEYGVNNLYCDTDNGDVIWHRYLRYFPQCILLCEQNITCKAVVYVVRKGNCIAFSQVLPEVNGIETCIEITKYAEKVTAPVTGNENLVIPISPIEKACSNNSECSVINRVCYMDVCKCSPGYSYEPVNVLCVQNCGFYGTTFQYYPDKLVPMNDVRTIPEISEYACAQECLNEKNFTCRSFDYISVTRTCHLTDVTAASASQFLHDINGSNYRQRDCFQ